MKIDFEISIIAIISLLLVICLSPNFLMGLIIFYVSYLLLKMIVVGGKEDGRI